MNIKPLIAIPSPRDIAQVKAVIDVLPADKLWLKYYAPEILAYNRMRAEFMKRDYTHLILIPDDLLVSPEHFQILLRDIEEFPYDVISGYCNVDTTDFKDYANITVEECSPNRGNRKYRWFHLDLIEREVEGVKAIDQNKYRHFPKHMIDVQFAGFGMFAIPRDIIFMTAFRNDSKTGQAPEGCCIDVTFCYDVIQQGRRILVDLRLREDHLKISDYKYKNFMAGVLPPYFVFDCYYMPEQPQELVESNRNPF